MAAPLRRTSLGGPAGELKLAQGGEHAPLLPASRTQSLPQTDRTDEVMKNLPGRDPFEAHRWRCIFNTNRAVQTLAHWARLDISIDSAVDLVDPADTWLADSHANASVYVYSDDMFLYRTNSIRGQDPAWNHAGFVNVVTPGTFVRLHVRHLDGNTNPGIGFVEFSVADIPFNQQIEGWFELRFEDRLKLTNADRYAEHCKRRDDTEEGEILRQASLTDIERASSGDPNSVRSEVSNSSVMSLAKKARQHSAFWLCRGSAPVPGASTDGLAYRHNAGEVFLRLKLTHVGSAWDDIFALALPTPKPQYFGVFVSDRPGLQDCQGLWDEGVEVKLEVYDNAIICVKNYVTYILRWRSRVLSLTVFILFVFGCCNEWLHGPIIVFSIFLFMFVNRFETLRWQMTCSGENAELSQAGFEAVSEMMDVPNMRKFLERTIEQKLGGKTKNESGQLQLLAERCFVDGMARVTYEDLMRQLKSAPWLNWNSKLIPGSLVLVQGRYRATVKEVRGEEVVVELDKDVSSVHDHSKTKERLIFKVEQVVARPAIYNIPMAMVPDTVNNAVQQLRLTVDKVRFKAVPILNEVIKVVTWHPEKKGLSMGITVGALVCSIVLFIFHEWYRLCGTTTIRVGEFQKWFKAQIPFNVCGTKEGWEVWQTTFSPLAWLTVFIMDHGFSNVILIVGSAVLLMQAGWLMPMFAVIRICKRRASMKRKAPKMWAFYRVGVQDARTSYAPMRTS